MPAEWQLMCAFYNSQDVAAEELSPHAKTKLVGFSIEHDVCIDYDKLDHSKFKVCNIYLNHHYRIARNKNVASGYGSFDGCVGGKAYLLYYHECLPKTGDKTLSSCAYPHFRMVYTTLLLSHTNHAHNETRVCHLHLSVPYLLFPILLIFVRGNIDQSGRKGRTWRELIEMDLALLKFQ